MERREFWLYVLCFLIFAECSSWLTAGPGSPLCLIEPENRGQAANDDNEKDCPTFLAGTLLLSQRSFEWVKREDNDKAVVAGFTVVLAISTIGLWLATNRLWVAGEKQLRHLSETAERQLRAYILAIEATVTKFIPDHPAAATVVVKNTGQTPAYDFEQAAGLGIDAVPPTFEFVSDLSQSPKGIVGPGETGTIYCEIADKIPKEMYDMVQSGKAAIWVWGELRYRDAFNDRRVTRFRFIYNGAQHAKGTRMALDMTGNEAT